MLIRQFCAAFLLLPTSLLVPELSSADPGGHAIRSQLQTAAKAVDAGEIAKALSATKKALHMLRDKAPLQLSRLTVLQKPPQGLGMFKASPKGQVHDGKLLLYVEVRNFVSQPTQDRKWRVDLRTDASFYYADGSFIARKDNIGQHHFVASTRHDVTFMVVELNLRGMPAQPYQLELTVHDANSGKKSKARCDFTIVKTHK